MITLAQCDSMSDFAKYENSLTISHNKLHLHAKLTNDGGDFFVNSSYLLNKYFDVVKKYCGKYTMTELEFLKYKYQPKMFSLDKLGTTELWSVLLRVNNMTSTLEFDKRTILVPAASKLHTIINEVHILESDVIKKNKTTLDK